MSINGRANSEERLSDCLRRLFPADTTKDDKAGTEAGGDNLPYFAFPNKDGSPPNPYSTPPVMPADVFAASGHLLQNSGAYHHIIAHVPDRGPRSRRQIEVQPDFIERARRTAAAWREFKPQDHFDGTDPSVFAGWLLGEGSAMADLYAAWATVSDECGAHPIFARLSRSSAPPLWWESALFLLMASDEASRDFGFVQVYPLTAEEARKKPWFFTPSAVVYVEAARKALEREPDSEANGTRIGSHMPFVSLEPIGSVSGASQDVVCVLPKARTTGVGCTLRSLSHHLALLPPRGIARAKWTPYLFEGAPPDERHMNLLLVPFPYSIPAAAFEPLPGYAGEGSRRWGFFDVNQTWLTPPAKGKLLQFVSSLATSAKTETDAVHGIVFPELALDDDSWNMLCKELPVILPELEFLVAGVSSDRGRHGNFVKVCVFQSVSGSDGDGKSQRIGFLSQREKHHRWTLERDEVLGYALEGRLSPSISWSENIDLLSRRVDFAVIRQSSVISAMICEDLARVDPCQELLRAIGPSIIFALLMDAPQLRARWPARYATILAEDPGSAVLTLTSRGLMTRQHLMGKHSSQGPEDRVVALWRDDDRTKPIEIYCPNDAHAVRLTLSGVPVVDRTLDGREDRSAVAWRHAHHMPVRIRDVESEFKDLIGPEDAALRTFVPGTT